MRNFDQMPSYKKYQKTENGLGRGLTLLILSLTLSLVATACGNPIAPVRTTPTACSQPVAGDCVGATTTAGAPSKTANPSAKPASAERPTLGTTTPAPATTAAPIVTIATNGITSPVNTPAVGPGGEVVLLVEAGQAGRAISPYIYGVGSAKAGYIKKLGATLNRWAASRYNWELGNAFNIGRYGQFANTTDGNDSAADKEPGGAADEFVLGSTQDEASVLLTIPAMGYVPKDRTSKAKNVPDKGSPALNDSGAIADYDPKANREATSLPMFARKPTALAFPPNPNDNAVYADEWLNHLVTRFGKADKGGIKFYAIDNEPDLWNESHTDVYPSLVSYDAMLQHFLEYAEVVKQQDPTAKVTGPVLSSPSRMAYSALDVATRNGDRRAHNNMPLLDWWLSAVRASDEKKNLRTLDVLDVHYYPGNELYPGDKNGTPAVWARRIEATRSLWDSTYRDPATRSIINLIPKMRETVEKNYPGTRLGISEWNFGGEQDISGAIAIADSLGIFGQQDLAFASYWYNPPENSPAFFGFKMFANYNDDGARFGDLSLVAASSDDSRVAIYAARRTQDQKLTLVAINKTASGQEATIKLNQGNAYGGQSAKIWRYSNQSLTEIVALPPVAVQSDGIRTNLPAYSITLYEIEKGK